MNKELKDAIFWLDRAVTKSPCYYEGISNEVDIVLEALAPPTEEEVCEALGEYYGKKVIYVERTLYAYVRFHIEGKKVHQPISRLEEGKINIIRIYEPLPPHLITLIGRFYEGKANDE